MSSRSPPSCRDRPLPSAPTGLSRLIETAACQCTVKKGQLGRESDRSNGRERAKKDRVDVFCKPARSPPPIEPFHPSIPTPKNELQQNRLAARTPQRVARVVVVKAADKASVSCSNLSTERVETRARMRRDDKTNDGRKPRKRESLTITSNFFPKNRKPKTGPLRRPRHHLRAARH